MSYARRSFYKLPSGFESWFNRVLGLIFYWRLIFVLLAIGGICWYGEVTYNNSAATEKLKNLAVVITLGSVIIGIFYSIVNYEHNRNKFQHEIKSSQELLTFNTAAKMHDVDFMLNSSKVRKFYVANSQLFTEKKWKELETQWNDTGIRTAFMTLLNYLEAISIGINQNIMDEDFMKAFFETMFRSYYLKYIGYIDHLRMENNSDKIFCSFTEVAERWRNNPSK